MPIPFHTAPVTTLPSRAGGCMYAKTTELRELGPAVPVELPDELTAWSVVRGDTVSYLLTHPDVSRDVTHAVPTYETGEVPWLAPWIDLQNMTTKDGGDHARPPPGRRTIADLPPHPTPAAGDRGRGARDDR